MTHSPWQKSSFSSDRDDCLELARGPGAVLLRESDEPGTVISATTPALRGLLRTARAGNALPRPR